MTTRYAFVGPTFPNFHHSGVLVLPPAKRGDILEIMKRSPEGILLVDGFFGQQPSIMHRELLQAVRAGIQVVGCSSMGALRAAELHEYGMIGVGRIFESLRCGDINGDDEVAMLHGPPELQYCEVTFPLCNLRSTVELASQRYKSMSGDFATALELASLLPFHDRTLGQVESLLRATGTGEDPSSIINALRSCWVDQKRLDLIEAIPALFDRPRPEIVQRLQASWAETSWLRLRKQDGNIEPSGVSTRLVGAIIRFYDPTFEKHLLGAFNEIIISRIPSSRVEQSKDIKRKVECRLAEYNNNWPDADVNGAVGAAVYMHPTCDVDVWRQSPPRQINKSTILEWARREVVVIERAINNYRLAPNFGLALSCAQCIEKFTGVQMSSSTLRPEGMTDWELWESLKRTRHWLTEPTKAANELTFDDASEMLEQYRQIAAFELAALGRGVQPWWGVQQKNADCLTDLLSAASALIDE
ncbi:MAG: hypothetical protein HY855_04435 [Burkholderiales bacterium]|nr:hypothetical protein [Burkholderiales bacterium]